jgi:hypothetical protein
MPVDVPLNTVIADLDDALRVLLRRELGRHGFAGVDIAFDAPGREWSGKLTAPTVDLFLYDLREALDRADITPTERRANGEARVTPPPFRLELTYAVTAWTEAIEDEHRLLSQVLTILYSYRDLPRDELDARVAAALPADIDTRVGRPREDKADFWTSVGGQYKPSLDFTVHVPVASGASFLRGPEVRTQTVRTGVRGGGSSTVTELHRFAGTVRRPDDQPVAAAWVALPDEGRWTATGHDGRFRLDRVTRGRHRVLVRTSAGEEADVHVEVPGDRADLVVGAASQRGRKGRRE